jgi:glycosyltransferase involved in cell wall biosynthesis
MHCVERIERTKCVHRIGFDATAIPERPAGAGNYILQLVTELTHLALVELKTESRSHELVIFIQQHGFNLLPAAVKSSSSYIEWVVLPDRRPGLRLAWEQLVFPWLARKYRLDLLHSPHYTMPWLMNILARRVKTVVTFHDMTFFLFPRLHTRVKRRFFPLAIRMSASRAHKIIACSESTRQDAIRLLHIPPEKIITVYEGIGQDFHPIQDLELLETTRRRYGLPEKYFLYVGTVEPRKNLPLLIQSFAQVRQQPDALYPVGYLASRWPLVIVGQNGWRYEEVYLLVEQLHLSDSVHFTGYVPAADIPILFNLASIFVYPSLYEGAGLPPLEALACGTPVITTNVSSMPEYVGEAAVLVPPGDSRDPAAREALTKAMLQLSHDPTQLEALAKMGPRQAADFTWKRTAQATLSVYKEALTTNDDRNNP